MPHLLTAPHPLESLLLQQGGVFIYEPDQPLSTLQLLELSRALRPHRLEVNAQQHLVIMAATTSRTSRINSRLVQLLSNWNDLKSEGIVFESNAGWTLPTGAVRSPDASWVLRNRYLALSPEQMDEFPALGPDFIVEIKSKSDRMRGSEGLLTKMDEWMAAGARLAWLIDPDEHQAWVYRPGHPTEHLTGPDLVLPGYDVLTGCAIALADLVRL